MFKSSSLTLLERRITANVAIKGRIKKTMNLDEKEYSIGSRRPAP